MARYDSGFGGPRGGWRGQGRPPFRGGFPEPGGMPDRGGEGARPDEYGGDWSRGYGAQGGGYGSGGAPRGWPSHGGHGDRPYAGGWSARGGGLLGGGNRSDAGYRAQGFGMGSGNAPAHQAGGWTGPEYGAFGFSRDRGEYGPAYEEYGGWPGDPDQGMTYGGGGYSASRPSQGRGYDGGYAREPFMPEEAYRRHPEYRQERQPRDWEAHQHPYGGELNDGQVREAVYRRMEADAWLDPQRIDVQVEDGVVTLTGEVDDFLEARYAWDDAWEAEGVRGVVNNLAVRSDQPHDAHGDIVPQSAGDRSSEGDAG